MTSSQWFDLAILAVALVAAVSGWRSGAVGSLLSFVGVVLGAVAGVLLAPHVVGHLDGGRVRLFATLFLILALVVIGEVAGVVLGRAVRGALGNPLLRAVDSTVGVALQVTAVLIASWMLATPLKAADQPVLAAAVDGSRVYAWTDSVAPEPLRKVPDRLSALLRDSGLPDVIGPVGALPEPQVDVPDPALQDASAVVAARDSVVKVLGVADSCGKMLEGTGFVVAPQRVMSNAHVVAGTDTVTVEVGGRSYDARVVLYDPQVDVSVLDVPELPARPLAFAPNPAVARQDAIVLGYPGGGDFTASPARIRSILELSGPDIYRQTQVTREVYAIRGPVRQGNSGGPLIDEQGRVLGVVFGAALDDTDTGYVMTAKEIQPQRADIGLSEAVPTGTCVPTA